MKVDTVLRKKGSTVVTTAPLTSVKNAADRLRAEKIAALVVIDGGAIAGIISERDIVHALSRYGEDVLQKRVGEVMTAAVVTCTPDDTLRHVMGLMTRHHMRHLPVLDHGRLAGIISIGDVVKHRLDELQLEADVMRDAYLSTH